MEKIKIIYEDADVLAIDKPAGIVVFPEGQTLINKEKTLIDYLIEEFPALKNSGEAPRYGIVHRLDKDTSGVILVAKSTEALNFFQKQFINREVGKKYVCLVEGAIENEKGEIKTLIARSKGDPRKQRVYSEVNSPKSAREAVTEYKVLERFREYSLLEVKIKTGRRHQIRCHFSYLKHPIAGDKLYAFKNSKTPEGLGRQFLHAGYIRIQLPSGEVKELKSDLPDELKKVLNSLDK